jgi:hypothetical protein
MRTLTNWLDAFMEYTSKVPSPEVFRRWAGISMLAAALERKVWLETSIGTLYPNLYIFMLAPPGVGKTIMSSMAWRTMSKLRDHKIASPSVTRATMIEELNDANRFKQLPNGGGTLSFNALYLCVNEIGVLLPSYEVDMMNKLTDIYDGHAYGESRRNKKHSSQIPNPIYNLLAAGTPGYLSSMLPEVAWEQGFMSRVLLIYSGEISRQSLFGKRDDNVEEYKELVKDLQLIGNIAGEFKFTEGAAEKIDEFYMFKHKETAPMHPKLQHYNTRRPAHLLKLMMISSIAEGSDLVIDVQHYEQAFEWLTDAEAGMANIFKAMNAGGDSQIIKELWYYVYEQGLKSNGPVPESRIFNFLSQRVPTEKIKWILDIMKSSKLLTPDIKSEGISYRANGDPTKA